MPINKRKDKEKMGSNTYNSILLSLLKKKGNSDLATTQMNLENVALNEISQ